MIIIPGPVAPTRAAANHCYFDKLQFWVCKPIDQKTIAQLAKECGRGGIYAKDGPARFDARYRQRVEFRQPSIKALRWLTQRSDALINRAEITIDLVFNNWAERDDTWEFLHQHLVRRWHGRKQEIRAYRRRAQNHPLSDEGGVGDTRYDAGRGAPNVVVFYREEHSRVTGELCCLHLEWRLNGSRAVRAAGIESGRDLLEFDHRQFWQKRLLLFDVDRRRLGRLIRNQITGRKRRAPEILRTEGFYVNLDGRTGEVYGRSHDTVQELIDQLGRSYRLRRVLVPISNLPLLPFEIGCGVE